MATAKPSNATLNKVLIDIVPTTEDSFAAVYVLATKKSVKRYCEDTGMPFEEGIQILYRGGLQG